MHTTNPQPKKWRSFAAAFAVAFMLVTLLPAATSQVPGDPTSCFDEQAYIQQLMAQSFDITNSTQESASVGIAPPAVDVPTISAITDLVMNASTTIASLVSGAPVPNAQLILQCVPPVDPLTLTDPHGGQSIATSTETGQVYFSDPNYHQSGLWTVTDASGKLITSFETWYVPEAPCEKLNGVEVCPDGPHASSGSGGSAGSGSTGTSSGSDPSSCSWVESRTLYENPAVTSYAANASAYGPYLSYYYTLRDTWHDNCGHQWDDGRSIRFETSIVGASKSTAGAYLYTALVGGGGSFYHPCTTGKPNCNPDQETYFTQNNAVFMDHDSATYLGDYPYQPAAYQAKSGGVVSGGVGAVRDLACSFVTQKLSWWASTMVCSGINFITSSGGSGDVPYSSWQGPSGTTDPWTGKASGGIRWNYAVKPNTYETDVLLPMHKTSNADKSVYMAFEFTNYGVYKNDYRMNTGPTQTWNVQMTFTNLACPGC